jgi:TonB-linked SusC/RagA family outer membrane protein
MKKKFKLINWNLLQKMLFILCFSSSSVFLYAQEVKTVTGTITDSSGEAVIGARIGVKGSTEGATSDINGKFTLPVASNATFVISYVGFKTQEIAVANRTNIEVILTEDTQLLDELVVVGYGSVKKGNLTSAISHVSSRDFLSTGSSNPIMQIQGKVAGMTISNKGAADPNEGASIQIRGVASRSLDTGPLVVIDGVPGADLMNLSKSDIESIDILKDGAASAIYGTRGSNGVVIVTTKKGTTDGTTSATYNGYVSIDYINDRLDVLSSGDFRKYRVPSGSSTDYGDNTNWFDAIARDAVTHNHELSFSGGSTLNNYRVSIDYRDAEGVDLRSERKEYGARIALNHKSKNGLYEVNANIAPRIINRHQAEWGAFTQALLLNPTMPIYNADGSYYSVTSRIGGSWNPVENLEVIQSGSEDKKLNWNGSFKLNLLPVIANTPNHNLSTEVMLAQQINDPFDYSFTPSTYTARQVDSPGKGGEASRKYSRDVVETLEWLLNYDYKKNGHSAAFVGGYSYQFFQGSNVEGKNANFSSDVITYNNLSDGTEERIVYSPIKYGAFSGKEDSKLIAFFGRVTYDYQSRYLLTASVRREGSSKFGVGNKWGWFPAVSVGWRLSEENFLKDIEWINNLKLRADYGVTGNQGIGNYISQAPMSGANDLVYFDGNAYTVWSASSNPNSTLRWEKGINKNIGLDFNLFNYRLSGSLNYYHRKQVDLLGAYNVPKPPFLFQTTTANVGTLQNTGLEVELSVKAVETSDFSYDVTLIGASCYNKFLSFSNDMYQGQEYYSTANVDFLGTQNQIQQQREGSRIGDFWMLKYAGIKNGEFQVYNKDNQIIPISEARKGDDIQKVGNGLPKYTASLNHTFRYKNLDLSVFFRGAFGFDIFNIHNFQYGMPLTTGNQNTLASAYGKNKDVAVNIAANYTPTSYFLEKGDYLKLDVISLGYTFKTNSKWINSFRIYGTARNLATFTKFSGVNPDTYPVNGLTPGFTSNANYYPSTTQILLGAQLNF